jgi:two-component system KDP operon response regulator KdpE
MADRPRLLIVDDEAALLRLMKTYLERVGYDVDTCARAADASERLATDSSVQAAIYDLSLISGGDHIARVARQHPALRILVCSGSPFAPEILPEDVRSRCAFLQKPFMPKDLVGAVEQLLARAVA